MARQDTLQQASFRGVQFEVEQISASTQRALGINAYPYRAGADIEDLDLMPRRWRMRVRFWGANYENQLGLFVDALRAQGPGALMHPTLGLVQQVLASDWSVEEDAENTDSALVNVEFVEDSTAVAAFTASAPQSACDAVELHSAAAQDAADTALVATVSATPPTNNLRVASWQALLRGELASFNRLAALSPIKPVLSGLDPFANVRAACADARAVLTAALDGLPFGGRNRNFFAPNVAVKAGAGADDFARVAAAAQPATLTSSSLSYPLDALPVQAHARVQAAATIAQAAAVVLAGELDDSLLERGSVELVANTARAAVQAAIDAVRACYAAEAANAQIVPLRATAYALEQAAAAVIVQRPPLIVRAAPVAGPMRLVAFALYADGDRAPELMRLNRYGRALFVNNGQRLNAYAR